MFTFTHRNPEMQLDKQHTALVLADMQNEFLEEQTGTYYELIADALKKRNVIAHLEQLLQAAQELGYYIIHSPHWYYPTDRQWNVPPGAIADYLVGIGFCGRKDPVDLEGFSGSRADYYEPFKKYLMDGHTCNTSPHKHFGCEANDVIKQLHMRSVQQVIMAGPVGNICLESHMRDIIEAGCEVAMVRDAVAGGVNEEGDGYEAAMINWRFMANALWTTDEAAVGNGRNIAESHDPDYITVAGDIGDAAIARKVVQAAIDRLGPVDTLINNVGVWRPGRIEDISEELFREVMRTNLESVFFCASGRCTGDEEAGRGAHCPDFDHLVEHALQTVPAAVASLSKGACVAGTRGLAMKLASSNIRVNAISLGIVETPLHVGSNLDDLRSFPPLNRNGKIEDVVRALNYLEDADYVWTTEEAVHKMRAAA